MENKRSLYVELPPFLTRWLQENGFLFEYASYHGGYSREDDIEVSFGREDSPGIEFTKFRGQLYMIYTAWDSTGEGVILFTMFIPDNEEEFLKLVEEGVSRDPNNPYINSKQCLNSDK